LRPGAPGGEYRRRAGHRQLGGPPASHVVHRDPLGWKEVARSRTISGFGLDVIKAPRRHPERGNGTSSVARSSRPGHRRVDGVGPVAGLVLPNVAGALAPHGWLIEASPAPWLADWRLAECRSGSTAAGSAAGATSSSARWRTGSRTSRATAWTGPSPAPSRRAPTRRATSPQPVPGWPQSVA